MSFYNIPEELRRLGQWVVFYVEPDPNKPGKLKKVPYIAQPGFAVKASSTDASTWRGFEQAAEICKGGGIPGYWPGFVLTAFDPYCVIDLDCPPTEQAAANHRQAMQYMADTYQEKSISGNGFHILCRAPAANGLKNTEEAIEIYTQERMIVFTGNVTNPGPIADHSQAVESLTRYLRAKNENSGVVRDFEEVPSNLSSDDILRLTCQNHEWKGMICRLLAGGFTAEDYGHGFSETTAKILIAIACESRIRDTKLLAEAFFKTAWFNSEVYQHHYQYTNRHKLDRTHNHWKREAISAISKAIPLLAVKDHSRQVASSLIQGEIEKYQQAQQQKEPEPEPEPQVTTAPKKDRVRRDEMPPFPLIPTPADAWMKPPGQLLDTMVAFYMEASQRPNRSVALAAALATLSGWAGRQYQTETKAGLTFYGLMFGKSGNGKNDADRGYYTLCEALKNSSNKGVMIPFLDAHTGPGRTTGDAAFRRNMFKVYQENNSSVSRVHFFKEVGYMFKSSKAGESSLGMIPFLLEAFGSSGRYERLQQKEFAMVENNVGEMKAANVSFLGEGTKESIFSGLDITDVASGLLPRFVFIDCGDNKPRRNKEVKGWKHVPESLLSMCSVLIHNVKKMEDNDEFHFIEKTPDAEKWLDEMCDGIDDYSNILDELDPTRAMLGRYHLVVERLAALAALSKNPTVPVVDMDCVTWAQAFMFHSYRIAMNCIDMEMSPLSEQRYTTVAKQLLQYLDVQTIPTGKTDTRCKRLTECGFIQWSTFRRNLGHWKGFKEPEALRFKRPNILLDEVMNEMIADGVLVKSSQAEAKTIISTATGGTYYRMMPDGVEKLNAYLASS